MNQRTSLSANVSAGTYRYTQLERVIHGRPFDEAALDEVQACDAQRVVIVTAARARGSANLDRLATALGRRHVATFCGVAPHVPLPSVAEGAALAHKHRADHLIALGGGSVMDTAKLMALALCTGAIDEDTLLRAGEHAAVDPGWRMPNAQHVPRICAIPQTLSAAEFTWFAGVVDPGTKRKHIVAHAAMAPTAVVLDPSLTLEPPLPLFLASGIKAVDHAIERLVALNHHPLACATSLHALHLLTQALPRVHADPTDLDARLQCQLGAWLSITGGQGGVKTGASHALGHVLGGHTGIPHGLTSCVLLPSVLDWCRTHNRHQQACVMAALGEDGDALGALVRRLVTHLGLPTRLRSLGIALDTLPEIARLGLLDPGMRHSPRPVNTEDDALEILHLAW